MPQVGNDAEHLRSGGAHALMATPVATLLAGQLWWRQACLRLVDHFVRQRGGALRDFEDDQRRSTSLECFHGPQTYLASRVELETA